MFGFGKARLPVSNEERIWIDRSFKRLEHLLGRQRMLEAVVMLPTQEHFPDPYDGSEASVEAMFRRVAERMQVDPGSVELHVFDDAAHRTMALVPFGARQSGGAGGLYIHDGQARTVVAINSGQLGDPMALVATLAHELGHVILLRPGLVARESPDMEPLNDLLTVFLGFGVFNANCAFQFHQYGGYDRQGWSTSRLGYLTEEQFGYALARFAVERGERKPEWAKYLNTNVGTYWKRSMGWIEENAGAEAPSP
jgi:hypothetical protein